MPFVQDRSELLWQQSRSSSPCFVQSDILMRFCDFSDNSINQVCSPKLIVDADCLTRVPIEVAKGNSKQRVCVADEELDEQDY
jgi:hypothetical protein